MPDQTPPNATNPPPSEPTGPSNIGAVIDLQIEDELKDSYLTYAMSTIMDRALPDVRDGLKPSQRRILVAMNDLALRPNKKHIKCAKICGDTSGNYHPHGEGVIYPTLAGMAQTWKMRVGLIDPQGNFGSINPDPPAAMRYTEARMNHAAVDMLEDLKLGTVDFQPNYDDRLEEPTVLPGKFPNLMINGGVGIAVGMATSLLPHNPGEILDAIVAVVDNPELSLQELLAIVPGPDFPTGGIIKGRSGIIEGYATGRGRLTVRGTVHIEEIAGSRDRQQIVIDRIPYQLGLNTVVERIADAVNEEKIKDITDVRNESGRDAPVRVVCELRRGTDPAVVENQLYQYTPLQTTLSIMNIALVHHQPRTLALRELIQHYIDHRVVVIERRTRHLLHEARKKKHILLSLVYAADAIDEVVRLIRESKTREAAIQKLQERRFALQSQDVAKAIWDGSPSLFREMADWPGDVFSDDEQGGLPNFTEVYLTRVQAEAIGNMRLIQLVSLEIRRIVDELLVVHRETEGFEAIRSDYDKFIKARERFEKERAQGIQWRDILGDKNLVLDMIKADCAEMKAKFASPRRTLIEEGEADWNIEALIQEHKVAVTITHQGLIKRVPLDTYREQNRGGRGIKGSETRDDDFVEHLFVASTHDNLLVFTDTGRVFKIKVYEVPEMARTSRGRSIVNLVGLRDGERAVSFMPIADFEKDELFLVFATSDGRVKRSSLRLYQNVNRSGIIALDLREGDRLVGVVWTSGRDHLLLGTADGMSIRFKEEDARAMGRDASGVKGIELGENDKVVGMVKIAMKSDRDDDQEDPELDLLTVTENGYGKRTVLTEYLVASEGEGASVVYRAQSRGGKGRIDIRTTDRNGRVVAVMAAKETEGVVLTTQQGLLVRVPAGQISRIGRATQGVRVVNLKEGDRLIAAAIVPAEESGAEDVAPAS